MIWLLAGACLAFAQSQAPGPPTISTIPKRVMLGVKAGPLPLIRLEVLIDSDPSGQFMTLLHNLWDPVAIPRTTLGVTPFRATIETNLGYLPRGSGQNMLLAFAGIHPLPISSRLIVFDPSIARFDDVPANHEWRDAISLLATTKVTIGCSITPPLFCPAESVTQSQVAAFIVRAFEDEASVYSRTPYFTDTLPLHPMFKYVQRAYELGIMRGCEGGQFCPEAPVTRKQMAVYLIRAIYGEDFLFPSAQRFTDVPVTDPAFRFVQKLAEQKITQGCGSSQFCPDMNIPREQMAIFIARSLFRFSLLP